MRIEEEENFVGIFCGERDGEGFFVLACCFSVQRGRERKEDAGHISHETQMESPREDKKTREIDERNARNAINTPRNRCEKNGRNATPKPIRSLMYVSKDNDHYIYIHIR